MIKKRRRQVKRKKKSRNSCRRRKRTRSRKRNLLLQVLHHLHPAEIGKRTSQKIRRIPRRWARSLNLPEENEVGTDPGIARISIIGPGTLEKTDPAIVRGKLTVVQGTAEEIVTGEVPPGMFVAAGGMTIHQPITLEIPDERLHVRI